MKRVQNFIVGLLCFTLPSLGVYAAAPDMHTLGAALPSAFISAPADAGLRLSDFAGIESAIITEDQELVPYMIADVFGSSETALPADLLDIQIQDEILIPEEASGAFWDKNKIGLLVAGALLAGLLVFFIGGGTGTGSGSGGGTGSGGGPGGPNSPNPNGPDGPEGPTDPNGPNGPTNNFVPPTFVPPTTDGPSDSSCININTDECFETEKFPQNRCYKVDNEGTIYETVCDENPGTNKDGGIPNTPEPSTMLLAALGLLVPSIRRRKALIS